MKIIAIDPDVERSGYAALDTETKDIKIGSIPNAELIFSLRDTIADLYEDDQLKVVIEAGWKNAPNWHLCFNDNAAVLAAKGRAQGRNEQVSRMLIEVAEQCAKHADADVEVIAQKPLRKMWQGRDRKITHAELVQFVPIAKARTNQEERDAALLAWNAAGLPIKLKPQ